MYGHLDKQPPMTTGWAEGTGPYTPVIKDGKVISLPFLFFWFY
jgi:acetylornithine deacetylase/succinyl-diaminopimelate desuccinylase-like protein